MSSLRKDLEADSQARRERRSLATYVVLGLRDEPAYVVLKSVADWLGGAYGFGQNRAVAQRHDEMMVERRGRRLLLWALQGDRIATWVDAEAADHRRRVLGAESVAVVAPAGVPDRADLLDPEAEVQLWGPVELEELFYGLEFEGVSRAS